MLHLSSLQFVLLMWNKVIVFEEVSEYVQVGLSQLILYY